MQFQIGPVITLDDELPILAAEADAERYLFLRRLCDTWASGENRLTAWVKPCSPRASTGASSE